MFTFRNYVKFESFMLDIIQSDGWLDCVQICQTNYYFDIWHMRS